MIKWIERHHRIWGTGLAVSETGVLVLIILITESLIRYRVPIGWIGLAASICGSITLVLTLISTARHFYYKSKQRQDKENWMLQNIPNLAACFFIAWQIVSLAEVIALNIYKKKLPKEFLNDTNRIYIFTSAIFWILSAIFVILWTRSVAPLAEEAKRILKARKADEEARTQGRSAECSQGTSQQLGGEGPLPENATSGVVSANGRRRSGSDTVSSIRRSLSNVVRPITSKTRLVGQTTPNQRQSNDSSSREREHVDEGFDSWDTSAVEPQPWQASSTSGIATPSSSKHQQAFMLETIPASPTTSVRSPSPGYPLDMPPPIGGDGYDRKTSKDSSRCATPTGNETHIHPLFRSDSPTPPPTARATSIITAAPNAGQAIPEAAVRRNRSASTPVPSPLIQSVTNIDFADPSSRRGEGGEIETGGETSEGEMDSKKTSSTEDRVMTPPIPEWVLSAGQRNERESYGKKAKRKKTQTSDV